MPAGRKPKRERMSTGATIAIAVVVIVATTIVPAVIIYLTIPPIIDGQTGPSKPHVGFSPPIKGGDPSNFTATFSVAAMGSPVSTYGAFRVQISEDGISLATTAQQLRAGTPIHFGTSVGLIVTDIGAEGRLTMGDSFLIYGMTGAHSWELYLVWAADGSRLDGSTWTTP